MGAKMTWEPAKTASVAEQETYSKSLGKLENISYGNGLRAIDGALRAILEWSGKQPHVLAARLRKLEARPSVEPRKRPVKGADEEE